MSAQTYDCPEANCSESSMNAEQFAAHIVGHGTSPSSNTLVDDVSTTRRHGRKPRR